MINSARLLLQTSKGKEDPDSNFIIIKVEFDRCRALKWLQQSDEPQSKISAAPKTHQKDTRPSKHKLEKEETKHTFCTTSQTLTNNEDDTQLPKAQELFKDEPASLSRGLQRTKWTHEDINNLKRPRGTPKHRQQASRSQETTGGRWKRVPESQPRPTRT